VLSNSDQFSPFLGLNFCCQGNKGDALLCSWAGTTSCLLGIGGMLAVICTYSLFLIYLPELENVCIGQVNGETHDIESNWLDINHLFNFSWTGVLLSWLDFSQTTNFFCCVSFVSPGHSFFTCRILCCWQNFNWFTVNPFCGFSMPICLEHGLSSLQGMGLP
jgi:hypothetical protein